MIFVAIRLDNCKTACLQKSIRGRKYMIALKHPIKDKEETAKELIAAHYKNDSQMKKAKLFLSKQDRIIRILELTDGVPSCDAPTPFSFDAVLSEGVPYPSSVILVNQQDWDRILEGQLRLPPRWNMKTSHDVSREAVTNTLD